MTIYSVNSECNLKFEEEVSKENFINVFCNCMQFCKSIFADTQEYVILCHAVWHVAADPACWGMIWRVMDGTPEQAVRTSCPWRTGEKEWKGSFLSFLSHCLTCHEM